MSTTHEVSATYLDTSALVKLVVSERESRALASHLVSCERRVTSALAHVELLRAVMPSGDEATHLAQGLLARLECIRITQPVLDLAASLVIPGLRSLDAIHVASASLLGGDLTELITYDKRMAGAARDLGWRVVSPD